ncbi:MAG: hypothetical protein L6R40_003006 [Gallowayella cf. fulva]|nr:MAG: hypothetical protein L6R40_003006 [Xanthomendoza cf. fulva]
MVYFNAYPPVCLHTSQSIPASEAQRLLAKFLDATTTDPSLHPNALLTEDGPMTASSGSTGLVLYNLKRVEAGLRREHLVADLTFKDFGRERLPSPTNVKVPKSVAEGEESNRKADQSAQQGWQDKEEYEREQAIEQGEVGSRNNVRGDSTLARRLSDEHGEIPAVQRAEGASKADKEDRKRKKKEKRDQKRREKEAERQKTKR